MFLEIYFSTKKGDLPRSPYIPSKRYPYNAKPMANADAIPDVICQIGRAHV